MSSKQVQSKISKTQTKFLTAAQLFQQDVREATTRHGGTLTEDMLATIDEKTSQKCKYVNLRLRHVFETTDGLVAPAWGDNMSRQPTTTEEPQSAKRLVQGAAAVRGAGSGKKKGKKKAKARPSRSDVSSRKNAVAVTTFRAKKQSPSEESKTFMIGSYCSCFWCCCCS